jgi:hypothetical protein
MENEKRAMQNARCARLTVAQTRFALFIACFSFFVLPFAEEPPP